MSVILEAIDSERQTIQEAIASATERLAALDEIESHTRRILGLAAPEAAEKPKRATRRPSADTTPRPQATLPPPRRTQPQPPRGPEAKRAEVLELIRELEPARKRDLVERFTGSRDGLVIALRELHDAGEIRRVGQTNALRYHLTATLDRQVAERHGKHAGQKGSRQKCRSDVLATIRDEPGEWSEQRIADSGAWDREQVAEACGSLLDAGEIEWMPNGRYKCPLAALPTSTNGSKSQGGVFAPWPRRSRRSSATGSRSGGPMKSTPTSCVAAVASRRRSRPCERRGG